MTRRERLLIFILACINFANIVDFMIMMPLQEYLVPVFNITPFEFNLLVFAYAASAFVSSFTASFFADKFDRKKALILAFSGFIIGTAGCGIAPTYELLILSRIVAGLFGGMISAQAQSIVGDVFPYEKRGRAMGALMGAFAAASVIGVPGSLWIAANQSWQTPFLVIAAFAVCVLPFVFMLVPSMTSHIRKSGQTQWIVKSVAGNRNMQLGLLMMFTLIFSHFAIIPMIAPYLEVNVGLHKEEVAFMYLIGGVVSLFSAMIVGKMADQYGKHSVFYVAMVLAAVPVLLITHMSPSANLYVYSVTSFFFLVAGGRFVPAQALIASVVEPHQRGSFLNLNSSLTQLATGLAALSCGAIVVKDPAGKYLNYEWVGYLGIAVSAICFYFITRVRAVDKAGAMPS